MANDLEKEISEIRLRYQEEIKDTVEKLRADRDSALRNLRKNLIKKYGVSDPRIELEIRKVRADISEKIIDIEKSLREERDKTISDLLRRNKK